MDVNNKKLTTRQRYGLALKVYNKASADIYFNELVQWQYNWGLNSWDECIQIEKNNLGYFIGYFDDDDRKRLSNLFEF